jgi:hypothetical protein
MDQLVSLAQQFGQAFTHFTHWDITSILIGMVAASLFEIPLIKNLKRH